MFVSISFFGEAGFSQALFHSYQIVSYPSVDTLVISLPAQTHTKTNQKPQRVRVVTQLIDGDKVRRDFGTKHDTSEGRNSDLKQRVYEEGTDWERELVLQIEWGRTSDVFRTIVAMVAIMSELISVEVKQRTKTKSEKAISEMILSLQRANSRGKLHCVMYHISLRLCSDVSDVSGHAVTLSQYSDTPHSGHSIIFTPLRSICSIGSMICSMIHATILGFVATQLSFVIFHSCG